MHEKNMKNVCKKLGFMNDFDVSVDSSKGGLSMAWKVNNVISLKSYSMNHINVNILEEYSNIQWRLIGFYEGPYARRREEYWQILKSLHGQQSGP